MKILLSGSSGSIGSALKSYFLSSGHTVISLPRTYEDPIDFSGADAVIHLAGENISTGRWSIQKKKAIRESRVHGTAQLAQQIASTSTPPRVFICASATGYYGNRSSELLDESCAAGDGFLAEVCQEWEAAVQPAILSGVRTINLRTGMVLAKEGGALERMIKIFRRGGGAVLGNGTQYMSWISLDDVVSAIEYIIKNPSISGPINLVAPNAVTNQEFTQTLSGVMKRPAWMKIPKTVLLLLVGEMADEVLLSSAKVYPEKLMNAGYPFKHEQLKEALRSILG